MTLLFKGPVWYWPGPAPYYFIRIPPAESAEIKAIQHLATYGWGVIPATVTVGDTTWTTSLFPKDGLFLVPVKLRIRKVLGLEEADTAEVKLEIALASA